MHKASGGSHQKKRKVFVPWKAGKNDCVYCRRDLGTEVRIHSAISDPALWPRETVEGGPPTFCVDCFGARVELGGHKSNHDYMIVDTPSMCLLSEDWTADEELRLLESLEKFGYGNWEAAAEHVGNGRTRLACERHYARFYQGSATFPLPDLSKPPAPRDDNAAAAEPPAAAPAAAPAVAAAGGEADGTGGGDAAQGQPDADGAEPPPPGAEGEAADPAAAAAAAAAPAAAPVLNERAKPAQGGKTKRTTAQTMPAGFMPLRGDFDTEWTDDAELQLGLGEMEFTAEDTAEDRALKMEVLHTYNWTLGERRRRKEFVLKQALLESVRDYPAQERRRTREERTLRTRMRPYARHHAEARHEELLRDMLEESTLRRRAVHLCECAAKGMRNLYEVDTLLRLKASEEEPELRAALPRAGSHRAGAAAAAHAGGLASATRPVAPPPPPLAPPWAVEVELAREAGAVLEARAARQLLSREEAEEGSWQAQLPAEKLVAAKRALVTLALQGDGAPLCKQEAVRALHPLLDPVSAAKLWRECAQLGLWSAAPPPSPPKPHRVAAASVAAASVAAAASAAGGGGGVKGAEAKGGVVKDAPFWAPWARPAARRRVRTPHAAFANAANEDEEPPPAAAAARK